ncbi:hypothetical protein JTE90_001343 [Oedothorax gibbosus]|uniref:Uncharacterized protein n=1 Tax=Oedothorax gibbosus TaxID=931172 RepID=A0AAV6V0H1_9ARAC|nr:hypothetical protein JTE90_001343 [Oedothorax gibbosus]
MFGTEILPHFSNGTDGIYRPCDIPTMILIVNQLSWSRKQKMPEFKHSTPMPEEESTTDIEDLSSQSNFSSKKEEESFNHPNAVPDNERRVESCFDNRGYEEDETDASDRTMCLLIGHSVSTFGQSFHLTSIFLKIIDSPKTVLQQQTHPFQTEEFKHLNNFSPNREMSLPEGIQSLQNLPVPEDQQWKDAESSAFISKKIQGIVQSFQSRVDKAKEKLVQPPTPSPSPPLDETTLLGDAYQRRNLIPTRSRTPPFSLITEERTIVHLADRLSQNFAMDLFAAFTEKRFTPAFSKNMDSFRKKT